MKYAINLLPEKEKDFLDKSIYFVLHYLRYVLVITQIVVIGVFFYRFKVDQEIIDLKDSLQQKQEIVAVSDPLLKEAEIVDAKTKSAKLIIGQQTLFANSLQYFLDTFPSDLTINQLQVQNGTYTFEARTVRPEIVRMYLEKLRNDKQSGTYFANVTMGGIKRSDTEFVVPFVLSNFQLKAQQS